MAISKVIFNNQTLMDLTSDTVTAATLKQGETAHSADGEAITGSLIPGSPARPSAQENDVILIDMDGEILYSYSAAEFAQLEALPTIPVLKYSFLQQDGWNWTLADAKAYVNKYGELIIGAQYTSIDGKDHVLIDIPNAWGSSKFFSININTPNYGSGTGTLTVDWGDQTTPSQETGVAKNTTKSFPHNYTQAGLYDIKVSYSGGPTVYSRVSAVHKRGYVKALTIGSGNRGYGTWAAGNYDLILLTGFKQAAQKIAQYHFGKAYIFPRGWTQGTNSNHFCQNPTLGIKYISWPASATYAGGGYNYSGCACLRKMIFPETTTTLSAQTLKGCLSIPRLKIPSTVTSIASQALSGMTGLDELHFYSATPPTVDNADAFTNLPTRCIIYVPSGKLNDYKTASNYPDPETYTYVEE